MANDDLLWQTIEKFWDTIPPVWGRVRGNVRCNATHDFNLTLIQFHILRHIWHGIRSVGELAEEQQISRPAVSQIVQILVEKGLVIRQTDAHDRRYVHLEITQSAAELLEAVYGKNRRWMAEKMASLNEEQLKTIQAAMEMLKKTFDPAAD